VTAADPNCEPLENEKLTQAELARPKTFFHFQGKLSAPVSKSVTAADPNCEPLENEKLTQAELARPKTFFHFRGAAAGQATLPISPSHGTH